MNQQARSLMQAIEWARTLGWVILDGTLIHADPVAHDRPYYSGKQPARRVRPSPRRPARASAVGIAGYCRAVRTI